jgi:hypothetical protein
VLFMHGVNPVFELPSHFGFAEALASVPQVISFATFPDETAVASDYIFPDHHGLESWGYQRAVTGTTRARPFRRPAGCGSGVYDPSSIPAPQRMCSSLPRNWREGSSLLPCLCGRGGIHPEQTVWTRRRIGRFVLRLGDQHLHSLLPAARRLVDHQPGVSTPSAAPR